MLAANIWHWWIGLILTFVCVLAVGGLVAAYFKTVVAQQYPGKRNRRGDED
ncbi:MAG: hypothetical protein AAB131_24140 [Actinomycetota bacterium]|jgi:uncharacterized iron-regulated membrane protein